MMDLKGKTLSQLTAELQRQSWAAYRARQLFQWLYKKGARDFAEMHDLPQSLRQFLSANYRLDGVVIKEIDSEIPNGASSDKEGTKKLVFSLQDGNLIEGVLIPAAKERAGYTLCVSTQVGCPLGCKFCLTGQAGFVRNLTAAEIVDQILVVKREILEQKLPSNVVYMGMGEPFLNTANVLRSLELLVSPQAVGLSSRRVTVSTVGIVQGIEALASANLGVNLAISLNATTDELRTQIMPINNKYPIKELLKACQEFPLTKRRRITFEYVLMDGVNDSQEEAHRLAELLRSVRCKINLIPYNPCSELPYQAPAIEKIEQFRQILVDKYYTVSIRFSKGRSIGAACGQLAAHRWPAEIECNNSGKPVSERASRNGEV